MGYFLLYFSIAFLLTWLLISPCAAIGSRYQFVTGLGKDLPVPRKNISFLGGIPIYLGCILTITLATFAWQIEDKEISIVLDANKFLPFLSGAALVSLAGLIYDVRPGAFPVRLIAQIVASALLFLGGIHSDWSLLNVGIFHIGTSSFYVGNAVLTILWVLLLIYVMDMLEVFDGMVAGIGIIASIALFAMAIIGHDYTNAFFSLVLAGSLLGTLWDQLYPANITLGKMGSAFTGFTLAAITLDMNFSNIVTVGIAIPVLLFLLPFIIAVALWRRKLAGKPCSIVPLWNQLHQQHVSAEKILAGTFTLSACCALLAFLDFWLASPAFSSLFLIIAALIGVVLLIFLTSLDRKKI